MTSASSPSLPRIEVDSLRGARPRSRGRSRRSGLMSSTRSPRPSLCAARSPSSRRSTRRRGSTAPGRTRGRSTGSGSPPESAGPRPPAFLPLASRTTLGAHPSLRVVSWGVSDRFTSTKDETDDLLRQAIPELPEGPYVLSRGNRQKKRLDRICAGAELAKLPVIATGRVTPYAEAVRARSSSLTLLGEVEERSSRPWCGPPGASPSCRSPRGSPCLSSRPCDPVGRS